MFLAVFKNKHLAVLFTATNYKQIADPLPFLHRIFPSFSVQKGGFTGIQKRKTLPHTLSDTNKLRIANKGFPLKDLGDGNG
jgi:hypothetical protein